MSRQLCYVFGEPGTGKSTLLEHLTRGLRHSDSDSPFAHRIYPAPAQAKVRTEHEWTGVVEVGKRRPDFPGTDALSMSVQPRVVQWLADMLPGYVIAEGDRLANGKFFDSVLDLGYELKLLVLNGSEVAALHRRIRGSNQDETWVRGRQNKAYNLAMERVKDVMWLKAGEPLAKLEAQIAEDTSNRVYAALREARDDQHGH